MGHRDILVANLERLLRPHCAREAMEIERGADVPGFGPVELLVVDGRGDPRLAVFLSDHGRHPPGSDIGNLDLDWLEATSLSPFLALMTPVSQEGHAGWCARTTLASPRDPVLELRAPRCSLSIRDAYEGVLPARPGKTFEVTASITIVAEGTVPGADEVAGRVARLLSHAIEKGGLNAGGEWVDSVSYSVRDSDGGEPVEGWVRRPEE